MSSATPCQRNLTAVYLPVLLLLLASTANAGEKIDNRPATKQGLPPGQSLETWPGPVATTRIKTTTRAPLKALNNTTVNEGVFTSHQVNVDANGNNIPGDAANEPSLAVDPTNPDRVAIGWRQFDSVHSSFRQAGNGWSDDGGLTWHNNTVLEPGVFRSDPVLRADKNGRFYYQSLKVENLNQSTESLTEDLWVSDNGGQSWSGPTFSYGGDKLWFAVDNTDGPYAGSIYNIWNIAGNQYAPRTFNYSTDGSVFAPPLLLPVQPVFGTITVGNDGEIYAVGVVYGQNSQQIWLLKADSRDSAGNPVFNQLTPVNLGGDLLLGHFINPVGLAGQVWVDVDRSNTPRRGTVYVAASVDPPGPDTLDVMLARSTDGGRSFEPPVRVNDDPPDANNTQWFGTLAVAPNGRIDLLWNDTRNAVTQNPAAIKSQLFFASSYNNGRSFTRNRPASPLFNQYLGYPRQNKLGDYYDIIGADDGAHLAWAATFNNEQDVYYLHAKPAAITENPAFPAWLMDNVWHHPDYPRQGIVSKTYVGPAGQAIAFDAIFSYAPDGSPLWLVMQSAIPLYGDTYALPIYQPTGDLSGNGPTLQVIGLATKSRLRDANGDLIAKRLHYRLDFSEAVMAQAQALIGSADQFDENAWRQSPLFGQLRELDLQPLIPGQQARALFCSPAAAGLESEGETAEGRLGYVFARGGRTFVTGADFTYQKTVDSQGNQQPVLDANGRAIPTWWVYDNGPQAAPGFDGQSASLQVYQPNTGTDFFVATATDHGISPVHTENLTVSGQQLLIQRDNGATETLRPLAANAFCGQ